ncbi:MAG: NAD+ synthase [Candidatus Anstonellaceae archaeon]
MQQNEIAKKAESFIREFFDEAGKRTAVVGVSGGVDSAVVLALCCRALGGKRVLAALLPSSATPKKDLQDAEALAHQFKARKFLFNISPVVRSFGKLASSRLSRANLSARVRMASLYALAQRENGLVVGTGDKSEILLGYFTKYGDGAADLFPIGSLYKTQVMELAKYLGIPQNIIQKPPSPSLWKGQTAQSELGFSYFVADRILEGIEKGEKRELLEKRFGKKAVAAVISMVEKNRHKRLPAPICPL